MLPHISLGQLHSNCEDADSEHDTRELKNDNVRVLVVGSAPCAWIEYIGTVWACANREEDAWSVIAFESVE